MKTKFEIESSEFKGPFDLKLTMESGQTSQPAWQEKDKYYQELLIIEGNPCLVKIAHNDDLEAPIDIIVESPQEIEIESVKKQIKYIFSLDDDLNKLYDFLRSDPHLEPTIDFCKGLRLFKAHDLFESVICSITSSHNSIKQWNKAIRLLKEKWGNEFKFPSGTLYSFPGPQVLASAPEQEFDEKKCGPEVLERRASWKDLRSCRVGYRSKYIIKASQMVQNEINLQEIKGMDYESAYETMLKIPGVGPKVGDCILLYGYGFGKAFPVDIWISRIISKLYFNSENVSNPKIRSFGIEKFGDYAGYTQLYLFHYARKSGLMDKLK